MEKNTLGKKIANLRKNTNMSQKELADKLSVSNKTISKWECGNGEPDLTTLQKISQIFNISVDKLLNEEIVKPDKQESVTMNTSKENLPRKKLSKLLCSILISSCIVVITTVTLLCYFFVPRSPEILNSKQFEINNENSSMFCAVDNNVNVFSLSDTFDVPMTNNWRMFYDINGTLPIESTTVNLQIGNNIFYILVENNAGSKKIYQVNIRRKPLYVVSFNTNGGNIIQNQIIQEGDLAEIVTPERNGYIFNSWNFDFNQPIYQDTEISANWIAKNLSITYFSNNGSNNTENQNVTYDSNVTLKDSNTFAKKGYSLVSWNTKSDGTGISYDVNKNYTNYNVSEDLNLYAQWQINQYQVITYKNFNNAGYITGSGLFDYNSQTTITANTNAGYTWQGWYLNGDLQTTNTSLQVIVGDSNIEYEAKWTANNYKITLNKNGGNTILNNEENVTFGNEFSLITPTRTEATFLGWYTYDNVKYTNQFGQSVKNWDIATDTELFAHWEINKYALNLTKNEAVAGTVYGEGSKEYNSNITISAEANDGYTFLGWYRNNNLVTDQTSYSFVMPNYAVNYNAKFKANTYTLTMNVNGGDSLVNNTKVITFNSDYNLPVPTRTGYTFDGWYLGEYGTGEKLTDSFGNSLNAWSVANNKTVYAKWTVVEYIINYVLNGGTNNRNNPAVYTIEDVDINLQYPKRDGYNFVGWVDETAESIAKDRKIISGSYGVKIFGAVWEYNSEAIAISTPDEFQAINNNLGGNYYLTNDIDFYGYQLTRIGDFTGNLDGCGYTIKNLNTNGLSSIFVSNENVIQNIIFDNITLNLGDDSFGAIIVQYNRGLIKNCRVQNSRISTTHYSPGIAFICVHNVFTDKPQETGIINCSSSGTIENLSSEYIQVCAGIVAESNNLVKNCYSNANIKGKFTTASGIVGFITNFGWSLFNGKIENCYFTGKIQDSKNSYGIASYGNNVYGQIYHCFVNADIGEGFCIGNEMMAIEYCYYSDTMTDCSVNTNATCVTESSLLNAQWQKMNLQLNEHTASYSHYLNEEDVWVFEDGEYPKLYWDK